MTDPISATASAVSIADRVLAAGSWVMRRIRGNDPGRILPGDAHDGLELRPLSYQIDLGGEVPRVRVDFIAINYLKKTIELRELKISLLTGTGHVGIANVLLDREVVLQPRSSFAVFCSRVLTDTEARGSAATPGRAARDPIRTSGSQSHQRLGVGSPTGRGLVLTPARRPVLRLTSHNRAPMLGTVTPGTAWERSCYR